MNTNRHPTAATRPTDALPGTEEKIAVLESRVANGEQLWHPADAGDDPMGLPMRMLRASQRNHDRNFVMRRLLPGPKVK